VSAVKSAVGHLLGAAGAVEAGLAVLALVERVAPPTAALTAPGVPVRGFSLVGRDPVRLPSAGAAVSNSFGFGGGNVSLVFGRAG
jgi:3-oxoacyl-[acyl-carrier-protein] synthase II